MAKSHSNHPKLSVHYMYILGVITEKPHSIPLKCNIVYIPIITLIQAMSHNVKITMTLLNLIGRRRCHNVIDAVPLLAEILHANIVLLKFKHFFKIFCQGLDLNEHKYKQRT